MRTPEENIKIGDFLKGKNLPLDLKVEILDHISEQMNFKTEIEGKDFGVAFSEVKESWIEDLIMKKTFFVKESRTKIHRQTIRKTNFDFLKKATFYFITYFIITLLLMFYSKNIASNFTFIFYCFLLFIFLLILIFNYKIVNFSRKKEYNNVSYLQPGLTLFTIANMFIPSMILFDFDERFTKYYNGILI